MNGGVSAGGWRRLHDGGGAVFQSKGQVGAYGGREREQRTAAERSNGVILKWSSKIGSSLIGANDFKMAHKNKQNREMIVYYSSTRKRRGQQ